MWHACLLIKLVRVLVQFADIAPAKPVKKAVVKKKKVVRKK
jgi:hypothetical protein